MQSQVLKYFWIQPCEFCESRFVGAPMERLKTPKIFCMRLQSGKISSNLMIQLYLLPKLLPIKAECAPRLYERDLALPLKSTTVPEPLHRLRPKRNSETQLCLQLWTCGNLSQYGQLPNSAERFKRSFWNLLDKRLQSIRSFGNLLLTWCQPCRNPRQDVQSISATVSFRNLPY